MAAKRKKKVVKKEAVYVLEYSHEHGTDLILCDSKDGVLAMEVSLIIEWIDDIRSETMRDQILAAVADRDFDRALELWTEYQTEYAMYQESFDLHIFDIPQTVEEKDIVRRAKDRIAEIANGRDT